MLNWLQLKGRQKHLTKKSTSSLEKFKLYFEALPSDVKLDKLKNKTRRKRNEDNISR